MIECIQVIRKTGCEGGLARARDTGQGNKIALGIVETLILFCSATPG